jgi:DnaJ like chaperone protein
MEKLLKTILIIFGLVYFLFPFDLIRDFIPYIGYFDDLALIIWIIYLLNKNRQTINSKKQKTGFNNFNSSGFSDKNRIKTCFEVLGLNENCSNEEIKKAYRALVSKYHPDKVEHLGDDFKEFAHEKFVEIKNAYEEIKKIRGF